jgi:hypothetical protein
MENTNVTEVKAAYPDATDLHLQIRVGACRLRIRPGEADDWVRGTYKNPTGALPLRVIEEGGTVTITQRTDEIWGNWGRPPTLELALGKARPYVLTIESGASESEFDLGGLPLTRLVLKQGAGKYDVGFSAPNPGEMSLLELSAGAVGMTVDHLANANAAEIRIEGGAAGYKLDFGGALRRDTHARVTTGLAGVDLQIPAATPAKITAELTLGGLDLGDGFMKKDGALWNEAALAGGTPLLTIRASVALGGLKLRLT